MGKPLLTDEIIERANRGEQFYEDTPSTDWDEDKLYVDYHERDLMEQKGYHAAKTNKADVYKSRRIENAKRGQFQKKLNKLLFWLIILLIILFVAVFYL
ncbi:cell wall synthase accessory phosphoprotein MacP [Streptococcus dentiloxodontae]